MKILVITTGGTIGSTEHNGIINVSGECAEKPFVVRLYEEACGNKAEFEIMPLMNILSENLCADDLNTLAKALLTLDYTEYDGVIVTCGSDNLAYLASFIGLLTDQKPRPVMIVAADKPVSACDSNGYENFRTAVKLISDHFDAPCVPYRDSNGMRIHSATDIRQADLSPDFYSFGEKYFTHCADIESDDSIIRQTVPDVFDAEHLPVINDDVMLIHPYPMLDYDAIDLIGKRAVLHTLYHSSTLNSDGAIRLMKRYPNVPVYLASFRSGKAIYQSAEDVIKAGAIPLYDISPECAYMKLVLACAQDKMSVTDFMKKGS